jgi:hypothetical protein
MCSPGNSPAVVVKFTQTLGTREAAKVADVLDFGPFRPEARPKPPTESGRPPAVRPDVSPSYVQGETVARSSQEELPDQLVSSVSEHPIRRGRQHHRPYGRKSRIRLNLNLCFGRRRFGSRELEHGKIRSIPMADSYLGRWSSAGGDGQVLATG